ncbi:hypothetical protein Lalb_Chr15g0078821 [Lupinus albus]|uniref:Uncharacterized protein n=1 Tax=Lupinus albus TaxID=3870 RepID=A0A6A4P972_LUPAL|nr:hypothetical protein Lalb_Chr15g0078821 [Lupinus albus]
MQVLKVLRIVRILYKPLTSALVPVISPAYFFAPRHKAHVFTTEEKQEMIILFVVVTIETCNFIVFSRKTVLFPRE